MPVEVPEAHYAPGALNLLMMEGIQMGAIYRNPNGQCLLVIMGVRPEGKKERAAIADGFRESKAAWQSRLFGPKALAVQA